MMDPNKLSPPPSPFAQNGRQSISREPSRTPKLDHRMSRRKSRTASLNENAWRGVGSIPHTHSEAAPPEIKKTRSVQPGLRAMLYGLAMKTEKEEAAYRKMQHRKLWFNNCGVGESPHSPLGSYGNGRV